MAKDVEKGPRKRVTAEWIADVKIAMATQGVTRKELAKAIGSSAPYISRLLAGDYETSRVLDSISHFLRMVPLAGLDADAPSAQALSDAVKELDEDSMGQLIEYAEFLKAKQGRDQ